MNQKIHQIVQYFRYLFRSKSSIGHGIHSPFVYELVAQVFNHDGEYYSFRKIEKTRLQLLKDTSTVKIEDFGAGSTQTKKNERKVCSISKSALLKVKYAHLLFRLANRSKAKTIVELGTSLGITSSYLSSARKTAKVYTLEGSPEIAKLAQKNFEQLAQKNIELIVGEFDKNLSKTLANIEHLDFAFIDGNHSYEPTMRYFEMLLKKSTNDSIFVFDDIYWSKGMTKAWKEIIARPEITISIDLFRMGLLFFRKENPKQDFCIRF